MSDFTIYPDPIRSAGDTLNQIAEKLSRLAEEAETVTRQVSIESSAMEAVRTSLYAACTNIRTTSSKVSILENALKETVSEYGAAEKRALEGPKEEGTVVQVPVRTLGSQSKMTAKSKAYSVSAEAGKTVPIGQKTYEKTYGKKETGETSTSGSKDQASDNKDKDRGGRSGDIPASGGKNKGGRSGDIPASSGKDKGGKSGDIPASGGKKKGGRSGDIPPAGGKDKSGKSGTDKNSSGKGIEYEIAGASAAGEVSGKIWSYEKDIPFGKVHAEALSAEAHGKATATLYARDTGDKIFADPRVEASAGVTLCALSGSASAHVGGKKAGSTGSVDASVGKAEATVKVTAGLRDKNGGLDPHLSGKASAELTAAEANASLKASVPGVDATVTAGAKVGLGAHANVTIGGGKIHCDVGAAVGVGANVGVDVNASGAVKAICDLAKAVGSVFTG